MNKSIQETKLSDRLPLHFSHASLITAKAGLILFLILVTLVPLSMVNNIIHERKQRYNQVLEEVSQSWSSQQRCTGPLLVVPYTISTVDQQGHTYNLTKKAIFLPDKLEIKAKVKPELRYRGIFEAVVYRSELEIKGTFRIPKQSDKSYPKMQGKTGISWDAAVLTLGITDMRRLKNNIKLEWGAQHLNFMPGTPMPVLIPSGIQVNLPDFHLLQKDNSIPFAMKIQLDGSSALQFLPLGKTTRVQMASTWPNPSFIGAFIPDKRKITSQGFNADWEVSYFGRNYPQIILTDDIKNQLETSEFGVRFHQPVDSYHQSERTIKYGVLFIIFTFTVYFIFELISGIRIHLFQYTLTGLALCTFFLVLIAFAEHVGFGLSYILSSTAVISQISIYSLKILQTLKRTLALTTVLILLYLYLYLVLQLEDYALPIGATALFSALGIVMFATRNVNWFSSK